MRVLTAGKDVNGGSRVAQAILFDPWPFREKQVTVKYAGFISYDGELSRPLTPGAVGSVYMDAQFPVLVTLEDGTVAVAAEVAFRVYVKQNGWVPK